MRRLAGQGHAPRHMGHLVGPQQEGTQETARPSSCAILRSIVSSNCAARSTGRSPRPGAVQATVVTEDGCPAPPEGGRAFCRPC